MPPRNPGIRGFRPANAAGRMRRTGALFALGAAAALAASLAGIAPANAQPVAANAQLAAARSQPAAADVIRHAGAPDAIKDSYIVVLKEGRNGTGGTAGNGADTAVAGVAGRHQVAAERTYRAALTGFAATMSEQRARQLAADPDVAYVEQNQVMRASTEQVNPGSWGLDRIDQLNLPLNSRYGYPDDGASRVRAYVIDTGIRTTHAQFGGRATSGFDAVDGGTADDCNGHGTHVAGTIGGATYGVAKRVRLVAVRVLNCAGSGTTAGVIEGVDWVTDHAVRPAVANMSLGGGKSTALDDAVNRSGSSGVSYFVAAGNDFGQNSCNLSPAGASMAITVAATDRTDRRASFSNIGPCVDVFAPGVDIISAWRTSDTATNTISGTSMASPHAAGVGALILQVRPTLPTAQLSGRMLSASTAGKVSDAGSGSRNYLLRITHGPITGLAGKCLDVRGGGTANWTPVQLSQCNGTTAQLWYWVGSEMYNPTSGRCLDVEWGELVRGTPTQIFDCNGTTAQAWHRTGLELWVDREPSWCLDVRGGNPANGTPVQIFDCNGTASQQWRLPVS